jgi:predicted SAM-dependent methyltransferase
MKLDIGTTRTRLEGFTAIDWDSGTDCRALPYAPNSIEEIVASHVLEHIPHRDAIPTVKHWVSLLKVDGILRIAVPDLDKILRMMMEQKPDEEAKPYEGWIMGGQTDTDDFHKSLWNEGKLRQLLEECGLENIQTWKGITNTCSAIEISLNLAGSKPRDKSIPSAPPKYPDMKFVMTMPRLAWTDNMLCVVAAGKELGMDLVKTSGVFYGQCMQRAMNEVVGIDGVKWIVTVDYDSLFDWRDIMRLRNIGEKFNLDMVAPIQSGRERTTPLFTVGGGGDLNKPSISTDFLQEPWFECNSMHFGLTLIRVDALKKMAKPWFQSQPEADGEWGESRIDDDVWFWKQARAAGLKFGICPSVSIGHIETVAAWSDGELQTRYQPLFNYLRSGKPWYIKAREQWRDNPEADEPPTEIPIVGIE